MAPTPSPILDHSSNTLSNKHFHHFHRQSLSISHHPLDQSSVSRNEQWIPRDLNDALQPTTAFVAPPPSPTVPMPSVSFIPAPEPPATPTKGSQRQGSTLLGDVPGNIVVAVVVVVLVLGGLIGLIVGGELLRRQTKTRGMEASSPRARCFGRRKPNIARLQQRRTTIHIEKVPREKTQLARPPPVLDRERHRKFSDVWPIRSLSRILYDRRRSPDQMQANLQHLPSAAPCPQTTWSEFSPVTLYVPTPRMILDRIPEECEEECENQANGDNTVGVAIRQPESSQNKTWGDFDCLLASPMTKGQLRVRDGDCQVLRDEGCKSLGSSAPDMTSDEGSSTTSLENLEDGNDKESLREEAFELRRVQTRSMQMNKGVLLSLSLKTLEDSQTHRSAHGELEREPSGVQACVATQSSKDGGPNLAMLGGTFSAITLDEFPSPPSILPVIPSFVSGF